MPRKTASMEQAEIVAHVVYTDANLAPRGVAMYESWARRAEELEPEMEELWAQDWKRIFGAFRRTQGAVAQLNYSRQAEEMPPLDEDELEEYFEEGLDWRLDFAGEMLGFTLRVWNYLPWEGQLAFALVFNDEEMATMATNLS